MNDARKAARKEYAKAAHEKRIAREALEPGPGRSAIQWQERKVFMAKSPDEPTMYQRTKALDVKHDRYFCDTCDKRFSLKEDFWKHIALSGRSS